MNRNELSSSSGGTNWIRFGVESILGQRLNGCFEPDLKFYLGHHSLQVTV